MFVKLNLDVNSMVKINATIIFKLIVVLPFLVAVNIKAASFDCALATTNVEKIICANEGLSKVDEELNLVYKEALKKSPDPAGLKDQQRSWLKYWQTECGTNGECIAYQWKKQIARLNQVIKAPLHKLEYTIFRYELKESYDDQVCHHMLDVFNTRFSAPWATESTAYWTGEKSSKDLPVLKSNPSYEEYGKYAFPKFPGVKHDARLAFEMRHTKLPTSYEFGHISWREGRMKNGEYKTSFLAADFDIDNDGKIETVLKVDFWGVVNIYSIARAGEDCYFVYSSGEIDLVSTQDYSVLDKKAQYSINGKFVRPFFFDGKIYMTAYEPSFGILEDSLQIEKPEIEEMLVQLYQKTEYLKMASKNICRYKMIPVGSIDPTAQKEK